MKHKTFCDAASALSDTNDGATLMLGGFGLCGIPENAIRAMLERAVRNLSCISTSTEIPNWSNAAAYRSPAAVAYSVFSLN